MVPFFSHIFLSSFSFLAFSITGDIEFDSFYDHQADYSHFRGRVTDRNKTSSIIKVSSSYGNIKFFHAGDEVDFILPTKPKKENTFCKGWVRQIEKGYFVLFVENLSPCWVKKASFRRGTMLSFYSSILAKRIRTASAHRAQLIRRREDSLQQLNEINHFLRTYDQQKDLIVAEYEKKILAIHKDREDELNGLVLRKRDHIGDQEELNKRLDRLDRDISFYRVEAIQRGPNRWSLDHSLGLPVLKRPQSPKFIK